MVEDVFSYISGREGNRISRGFNIMRGYDSGSELGLTNESVNPNYEADLPYPGTVHEIRDEIDMELND